MILHVVTSLPHRSQRTLTTVRDRLTRSPDAMFVLPRRDADEHKPRAVWWRAPPTDSLARASEKPPACSRRLNATPTFLDSPRMAGVLARNCGLQVRGFETRRSVTVFLVLPPERLATHARWLRLLVVQALAALAKGGAGEGKNSVLFVLDEFAALGHLEAVERAYGLMAGYGVQLWAVLQDLHQLKSCYDQHAGTFLSNAGLIQVFNVADVDTASWVSRSLGSTTEVFSTTGTNSSQDPMRLLPSKSASTTVHQARWDLMTPDEVMRLDHEFELLLQPGFAPTVARKVRYYQELEFSGHVR